MPPKGDPLTEAQQDLLKRWIEEGAVWPEDMKLRVELLAEGRGRAYVITDGEKLVVMDNARAKRLHSVNFAGATVHLSNTGDDKFYIADKRGRVVCLQPAE